MALTRDHNNYKKSLCEYYISHIFGLQVFQVLFINILQFLQDKLKLSEIIL